jgi:hypothetical protein
VSSLPSHRDLMAPDTEPTDEELHLVMREALELAMARKQATDAWIKQRLWEEVARIKALQGPSQH